MRGAAVERKARERSAYSVMSTNRLGDLMSNILSLAAKNFLLSDYLKRWIVFRIDTEEDQSQIFGPASGHFETNSRLLLHIGRRSQRENILFNRNERFSKRFRFESRRRVCNGGG